MFAGRHRIGWASALLGAGLFISACGGGGGGDTSSPPVSPSPPPPPPVSQDDTFSSKEKTARFLNQATFGATATDVDRLTGTEASDWFVRELNKPATLNLSFVNQFLTTDDARNEDGSISYLGTQSPTFSFWNAAIEGDDQLRQRMSFALSQILVVSHTDGDLLANFPQMTAHYQDTLTQNAFGNYRDLLEEVTYSPAMGIYLTYWQNQKADPDTGRMPDENYAREILQLFSIGLVELNMDGTPKTNGSGEAIEIYDNEDITGLAKVFTGLSLDTDRFFRWVGNVDESVWSQPMVVFPRYHSDEEKTFLGTSIPADTPGEESIDRALDTIFEHPNLAPFIGRQLIQRFVTSHPDPDYVERVSAAFEAGQFTLPDGEVVGTGERGDLAATLAAVLFDEDARAERSSQSEYFGKVREPVIRFVHWARAFDASEITPEFTYRLWNTGGGDALAQAPYKSPSVFNFYRPGYIAPGTETGAASLTMPELQLVNATSITGYTNFMTYFVFGLAAEYGSDGAETSFIPDYRDELVLADDTDALLDRLDLILTAGAMSDETRASIKSILDDVPLTNENDPNYDGAALRTGMAILMIMSSPDYLVQR